LQAADARDYYFQSEPTRPQWTLNIYDIMLAHDVSA